MRALDTVEGSAFSRARSIYIINPASSAPNYHSAEAFADAQGGWTQVADLAIATVAAFVPDGWDVRLTDESLSPVDFDSNADFIAITGKASQRSRMIELATAFRRRGRTVLIGGPFASLTPEEMRPHADILVTGELEGIAPKLFSDLASGQWAEHYDGGQADVRLAPVPRWDLYPTGRALSGCLQTTRGCPFNCEFCDVIQYQGRKQRHKTIKQVSTELAALHAHGFREVFIADDNFTVHRRWAREVLDALIRFNAEHADDPVRFATQASLDVAREGDLLDLCRKAGIGTLFVGVETMNAASLREAGKLQNLLMPVHQALSRIVAKGIAVQAGLIVGFDHDGPGIFKELLDFLQETPIPHLNLGVLTAPPATHLFRRLTREGRIVGGIDDTSVLNPFLTNIRPAQMSREALLDGAKTLCVELYTPARYQQRMLNLIRQFGGDDAAPAGRPPGRDNRGLAFGMLRRIAARGGAEAAMVNAVIRHASRKPAVMPQVIGFLMRYEQARHLLDLAAAEAAVAA